MSLPDSVRYPHYASSIKYSSTSSLNTLSLFLPRPLSESLEAETVWLIYIHGGAWRDPLLDCSEILPALRHLYPSSTFPAGISEGEPFSTPTSFATTASPPPLWLSHVAGIASLNYRLSPYPNHPTHASSPSDLSRNVTHPSHLQDIISAMTFLSTEFGVGQPPLSPSPSAQPGDRLDKGYDYVALGHSCGATLWMQLVSSIGASLPPTVRRPVAAGLAAGIYDLPAFLHAHAEVPAYGEIVRGAFGGEEWARREASPVCVGEYGPEGWPEGWLCVLGHSGEDELLEVGQVMAMAGKLGLDGWVAEDWKAYGGKGPEEVEKPKGGEGVSEEERDVDESERKVVLWRMKGGHDDLWRDGVQLTGMMKFLVERIFDG